MLHISCRKLILAFARSDKGLHVWVRPRLSGRGKPRSTIAEKLFLYSAPGSSCAGQQGQLGPKPSRQTGRRWADGWEDQPPMPGFFESRCGRCAPLSVARRLAGRQIQRLEAGRRSGSASVSVVETANLGLGDDPPLARWFYLPRTGCVAFEGLVGPRVVVVGEVLT